MDKIRIRPLEERDIEAVVELSLRAWEPVFESMRDVLGEPIFARLHVPDWRTVQADAVRSSCVRDDSDVFVAIVEASIVGFATVMLNAYHDGMGVVDMIAVDPPFQRQGVASLLMSRALDHMRESGMDIAAVGTGGDPGHAPARALYEARGFTPLPAVRYLKLIS